METELTRGAVKVVWTELGEGYDGDYDPDNPDDVELLRFDFYGWSEYDEDWKPVVDASYCTQVPVQTSGKNKQALLNILLDRCASSVEGGINGEDAGEIEPENKRVFEEASWISPKWLRAYEKAPRAAELTHEFEKVIF